jgi:ABC-2 type transport system permease protein
VLGVNFATFVAPGLIVMGMMQNAFANASFSFLSGKMQGTIIDYLMPPLSEGELMLAMIGRRRDPRGAGRAGAGRWPCCCGRACILTLAHPWAVVWFGLMGAMLLALVGLLSSIWAEKFDHNAAITNFVIAPLSLLSGTFYVIDNLAPAFQAVSRLNPFFYVISGFRFGFLGRATSAAPTLPCCTARWGWACSTWSLGLVLYRLLRSGWKLKS